MACTHEQGTVNARVSAFRSHAPRNAFCAVGASLGPKGVCSPSGIAESPRAAVLTGCRSSHLAQNIGLFWSMKLVYIVVS